MLGQLYSSDQSIVIVTKRQILLNVVQKMGRSIACQWTSVSV